MHILFLTDNFPPESNAPASRTYEHAVIWAENGHKVTVVTCVPNFPAGKVFPGYKNRFVQSEYIDGIKVIRVWSFMAKNTGFFLRLIDFLSFMLTSFVACLFIRKVDVIVGTSPQFFTCVSAWAVAKIKRQPFVFELRDLWPDSIEAVGIMEQSVVLSLLRKIEMFLYRQAALIVAVTHSFKKILSERGIAVEKIAVITNGIDTEKFKSRSKNDQILGELDLSDKFVIGYIGTVGAAHALETVIQAASKCVDDPACKKFVFLFVGQGAEWEKLQRLAIQFDCANVKFVNAVPRDEIEQYWSVLDVSIIHLKNNRLFDSVIPSKLFEIMAMGIPVIHGVRGESSDIVKENNVGMLFEPENPESLVHVLKRMQADIQLRDIFSQNAQVCSKNYDRKFLALRMERMLSNVVSKGK